MPFLRAMTFNMQLLPAVTVPRLGIQLMPTSGNEAEERAVRIADAITAMPTSELPDILAANEVTNEDARDVLVSRLKPLYPFILPQFDDPVWRAKFAAGLGSAGMVSVGGIGLIAGTVLAQLLEDSGLFFASRFPIAPQPGGNLFRYKRYEDAREFDRFSAKGVAVISVTTPLGLVTFAISHNQADYKREAQYAHIRRRQLADIEAELAGALGPPGPAWRNVVVMGDLNIRGDLAATQGEHARVFAPPSSTAFATTLVDGWRRHNRRPDLLVDSDPGFTNDNLEEGQGGEMRAGMLSRLDYIVLAAPASRTLVAQQMRTRFRTLSDHWSLEADLHVISSNCTPETAISLPTIPNVGSGLRVQTLNFASDGSYQWVFTSLPGTFSVWAPPDVEFTAFEATDLTNPRTPFDRVPVAELEIENLDKLLERAASGVSPRAEQVLLRGAGFFRFRAVQRTGGRVGSFDVAFLEHRGETPGTAFFLEPFALLLNPLLPPGQSLGAQDWCWFKADIDRALSGVPHASVFEVRNATGDAARFDILDTGRIVLDSVSHKDPLLSLTRTVTGPERVLLRLRRALTSQVSFLIGWRSSITYLRSSGVENGLLQLRCIDETGIDRLGADEIKMQMKVDGVPGFVIDEMWLDADTKEKFPLPAAPQPIAFLNEVQLWVSEQDFVQLPAVVVTVPALGPADAAERVVQHRFKVETGTYRLEGTRSRTRS